VVHNLGLLLDVDGPIASPITRTIAEETIVADLVTMAAAGIPIAFITGRSDASVEQRTDVDSATYREAQVAFNDAAFDLVATHGLGVRYGDRSRPDDRGDVPFRLDPTIISTDIESVLLDKDRGAERALEYFARHGDLPRLWRSVGDSRSDYLMADHLHAAGYDVAHVDVRPGDGVLERPYQIVTIGDAIHDEAGAAFLAHWVDRLSLR
jgi:hypothetical protein